MGSGGSPIWSSVSITLALLATQPVAAYQVVLEDERVLLVDRVGLVEGRCALYLEEEARPCPDDVDFLATLRANLADEGGNVVLFRTGGWLSFESLDVEDGRAQLHLGDDAFITVSAAVLDARRSVLEGATLDRPASSSRAPMIAKERPSRRPTPTRSPAGSRRTRRNPR